MNHERARLMAAGKDRLASPIDHVSESLGDHVGFDILSYDEVGRERLIEVKTTGFGRYAPFFVTLNELSVSRQNIETSHLYRVHSLRSRPGMFMVPGRMDRSFDLAPSEFLVRLP